jgi:hypothetical protein
MGAVATFDYGLWVATYPEFNRVTKEAATSYFTIATAFHANNGSGPIADASLQLMMLNMVTAHIAAIYSTPSGAPAASNTLVGRLNNVSEGSVSASSEFATTPVNGTMAWYLQTKYGAMYWAATAPYRTMRYRAPVPDVIDLAQLPWLYSNDTN